MFLTRWSFGRPMRWPPRLRAMRSTTAVVINAGCSHLKAAAELVTHRLKTTCITMVFLHSLPYGPRKVALTDLTVDEWHWRAYRHRQACTRTQDDNGLPLANTTLSVASVSRTSFALDCHRDHSNGVGTSVSQRSISDVVSHRVSCGLKPCMCFTNKADESATEPVPAQDL